MASSANNDNITQRDATEEVILPDAIIVVCHWIIYPVMCQTICTFGTVTNIINIICFVKQGFKDPVNVSLLGEAATGIMSIVSQTGLTTACFRGTLHDREILVIVNILCLILTKHHGLAISDIGCLLTMTVANICFTPAVRTANLPFDPIEFAYLTGGMPHTTFTRITGWFTALITLERCLCITAPLQIKTLVTSKRMTIIFVCVFLILIGSVAPVYVVNRMDMKFFPEKNKTLLGLFYTEDRENVERFSFAINNTFLPFSAFVIIITCTIILAIILKKKSKWLTKSTSASQADNVSNRNKKVAKMVVMISTLFIACFIPLSITFLAMCLFPEFSVYGKYRDILFITGGFGFILETINSSMNIFIYHHMSSKYKHAFRQLFRLKNVNISE